MSTDMSDLIAAYTRVIECCRNADIILTIVTLHKYDHC